MSLSDKVKARLQELPDKPGVYLMRDRTGRVIYVGKASSLRNRVRHYFQRGTLRSADPKLRGLIHSIHDFDFLVVRTEAEATLTEGRLIKEYRPRYNVSFRDDKRFLLLRIDLRDPFPRFTTRRIERDDGATYFGPYVDSGAARAAKEFVEKRFGIRACSPRLPGPVDHRHCLNDIVRYCSAPCVARVTPEGYRERVDTACAFLRGERPEFLQQLEEEMRKQAEELHFERAAELRDTYTLIRKAIRRRIRGEKDLELKREDATNGLRELKEVLTLPAEPRLIECFDISNISGTLAVGSMVCCVEGVPDRKRYRLFRIRTVEGSDDPAMMAEVIRRRYGRVVEEGTRLPDLVLVDGGVTQLRAARAELTALGLERLPAAGLAKRFEELHLEGRGPSAVLRLPLDSAGLKILQRIRDEAHRFALTYHRKLRAKRLRESVLDEVQGVGEKRKRQLLTHFGSIDRLRRATEEAIREVPGIGPAMARDIFRELHRDES